LTLLTLLAGWRGRWAAGPLFVGALALIMVMLSPVCHAHYFVVSVPVVMGLLAVAWERDRVTPLSWALVALFVVQLAGNTVPLLPKMEDLRDGGLALYMALLLWAAACVVLWREGAPAPPQAAVPASAPLAA
jgi:hypothetical protein